MKVDSVAVARVCSLTDLSVDLSCLAMSCLGESEGKAYVRTRLAVGLPWVLNLR